MVGPAIRYSTACNRSVSQGLIRLRKLTANMAVANGTGVAPQDEPFQALRIAGADQPWGLGALLTTNSPVISRGA